VNSLLDPSFDYTPGMATDIQETFERVWRQLDEREQQDLSDVDRDSLWLECDSDLVDSASVQILGVRRSGLGVEMIEFVCPHCNGRHESLRFR